MRKPAGLRAEIVINLIILLSAALVFVSVLQLKVSERELLRERVTLATSLFEAIADSLGAGMAASPSGELSQRIPDGLEISQLTLFDPQLVPRYSYRDGVEPARVQDDLDEARFSDQTQVRIEYDGAWWPAPDPAVQRLVVSIPYAGERGDTFVLQADISLADLRSRLFEAQQPVMVYLVCFGVILVVFGATLIGRTVVLPIRRLMLATQEVARGELTTDVAASGLRELAELASSFNSMTAALRDSRQETAVRIEELSRTNRELTRTRDELVRSEKLASVGHLAAGMAHEIGNPLGALMGYLGLLEQETDDAGRELVVRAQGEAARIDRLVRELLDYAAPAHLSREPFDPVGSLREALDLLEHQCALSDHRLEVSIPERLPLIHGNPAKLVQIFLNLLLNARDATPAQGVLRVSARQQGDVLTFELSDTGSGIPAADLPHIFDPFFTTKPEGKGRGLGLAVCHHLVAEMGGRIDVVTEPGQGTRFTLQFPVVEDVNER